MTLQKTRSMKKITLLFVLIAFVIIVDAQQFDINADVRARYEMRNGYASLKPDSAMAANFITQRSRIVFDYRSKNMKLRISPQNVHVWGDVSTTSKSDLNNSFHEAYGEIIINKYFSFKLGRQEIDYDNARIFGNVDWTMQARSHDAALIKINLDSTNKIHLGFALNANKETNFREKYLVGQYKAFQFVRYEGKFKTVGVSFLFLNNGVPYIVNDKEKLAYSQTIGGMATYKKKRFNADFSTYRQTGKIGLHKVNAQYLSLNTMHKIVKNFAAGFGFEYLSGKATSDSSTEIKSFNPLYGTNHKFNGYMDYFYVGNHFNSVGLTDIFFNFVYEKDKISLKFTPHYFLSPTSIYICNNKKDNYLGTELDFTFGYTLFDNIKLDAGYSQMLASKTMEVLKAGNSSKLNNWVYLSLKFNPKFLSYKLEKE